MVTVTPWVERKFDFNFPVGVFPIIVERLRGTLPQLNDMIKPFSDEELSIKKDGKWSVKEVMGHLFDLEDLWNGRIDDFLDGKETLRAADMTNAKTHAAKHNSKSKEELFQNFSEARTNLITRVSDFEEAKAALTAIHPRLQKPMRLVDSLYFAAEHDDHELTKIRRLLS